MKKLIVLICVLLISSTGIFAKKYKILFDKDCSNHQARKIIQKIDVKFEIVEDRITPGKISLLLQGHPKFESLERLLKESKSLVSYQIYTPRRNMFFYKEALEKAKDKKDSLMVKNVEKWMNTYSVNFFYDFETNSSDELNLVKEIFDYPKASYQKDANEVVVEIDDNKWEEFLMKINQNERILSVREVI